MKKIRRFDIGSSQSVWAWRHVLLAAGAAAAFALLATPLRAATNDLTAAIQRGLFEEEANQNLGAAIQAYQTVASQFDKDRKLAATAIFRLGECYRKQGNTNEAAGQFERILREFSDQSTLVTLSRQNLATLGTAPAAAPVWSDAARQEQKRLLEEEMKLVQKQLESDRKKVEAGMAPSDALLVTERELLKLKRQIAAVEAGQPISVSAAETPAPSVSDENAEVRRIQALIKDSPDLINAPDARGETLLQQAAAAGKLAIVKLLLDSGAAVDGLQQPGFTALHYAAGNGHKAVVDLLLSRGAKPSAETGAGVTPLHIATLKGYESVVKALLAAGAPVNVMTRNITKSERPDLQFNNINSDVTPLHLAVEGGYSGLVELMLAKGADINAGSETALTCAVRKQNLPIVRLLLAAHADPNAGRWKLPLFEAIRYNDVAALKLLLASGADPNTNATIPVQLNNRSYPSQGTKSTPLFYAVNQNQPEAVTELLRAKADPNTLGPEGDPVLFEAMSNIPTLKALLEGGVDPNRPDRQGVSPLLKALGNANQESAAEVLLAHKADVNARMPETEWTSLHLAAQYGRKAIAEQLLKAGAAINAQQVDGWTPLFVAAGWNQAEVARVLLANHADPNLKAKDGRTPLHVAVNDNRRELIDLLLANGADPNERDNAGRTPLDIAKNIASAPRLPGLPVSPLRSIMPSPGAALSQATPQQSVADLLRQHGASDNLPRLDCIIARRSANNYANTIMAKGAKDWNHFTLLELLGMQYKMLAQSPGDGGGAGYTPTALFMDSRVPFPDLTRIHISRPAEDKKGWQDQVVDLSPVLNSGDCAKDVRLGWGDVVEIPEADHTLNEYWKGFSKTELANFKKCLTRQVEIVVKGQATQVTLAPRITLPEAADSAKNPVPPGADFAARLAAIQGGANASIQSSTPFWLKPVLLQSKLVLVSSDLSRVKVIRRDAGKGEKREWVVDCSEANPAPDFWLEDGDRIEVPEKTYSYGTQTGQALSAPASGVRPSPGAAVSISSESPVSFSVSGQPGVAVPGDGRTPGGVAQPVARSLRVPATPPRPIAPPGYLSPNGQPPKPPAIDPLTGLPVLQPIRGQRPAKAAKPLSSAGTLEEDEKHYLVEGSVWYSPKTDDPGLLQQGLHKDRSVGTRQAECWEQRASADLRGRACPGAWTGSDLVVFGGEGMGASFADGARYCLAEDTWAMLPSKGAPSSRTGHAMAWTGKEVIVWGGFGGQSGQNINHNDGARYNPVADAWKAMTTKSAPEARFDFTAVWSGREFLVWGGYTDNHSRYQGCHADAHLNTGGRYSPTLDSWRSITTRGAPSKRNAHTAVWSGSEMIIWGGGNTSKVLGDGGRYNPSKDSWRPISSDGAPGPRAGHVAVWTGKEMLVWGGAAREPQGEADYYVSGGRYDPATDTWKPMSAVGAPSGRVSTCAVWTGKEMLVWGGVNDSQEGGRFAGKGGRYNPGTDSWTEMTLTGAPSPRLTWGSWTGDSLVTFGGYNGVHLNDCWLYSPSRTLYPYTRK